MPSIWVSFPILARCCWLSWRTKVELLPLKDGGKGSVSEVPEFGRGTLRTGEPQVGALCYGWKVGAGEMLGAALAPIKGMGNSDVIGEILVFRTQAVNRPGSMEGWTRLVNPVWSWRQAGAWPGCPYACR